MKTELIKKLVSILKDYKSFEDMQGEEITEIQAKFDTEVESLSDLTLHLLSQDEFKSIIEGFDVYGPLLFEEIKAMKEEDGDPYYEEFFYYLTDKFREKNQEYFYYLSLALFYSLNAFSEHSDPWALDKCIIESGRNGMLHLLAEFAKEPLLEYLCNSEGVVEDHFEFCEGKYPERLKIFLQDEDYNDYLPDEYRKEEED
ncbi:hypothetical protein LFX15_18495 [Leptospira levettii]|uniref:hypothetical protein n=1 Tax=Leptospira levettii TaxID=2023178 RepID=UPI001EE9B68D|nr:hypothetical protein [Leptospira levettii]MCG6150294.1 hypothetical protein [Leptospira levettii]